VFDHLACEPLQRAMREPTSRHGPLVLLRLGRLLIVVASSVDATHEMMCFRSPNGPVGQWPLLMASSSRTTMTPEVDLQDMDLQAPQRQARPVLQAGPGVGNLPRPPRCGVCATSIGSELRMSCCPCTPWTCRSAHCHQKSFQR
jgi:hypothetical protein